MTKSYYLIDFENVQPKALDRLKPGDARIKVFLGQHQNKLMLDLVQALQPFGADAEYIAITGSGPDAVDFHIAYYIGRISAEEPDASFRIISKDKGFDPLVRHLSGRGIGCERLVDIPSANARPAAASPKQAAKAPVKSPAKKAATKVVVQVKPAKKAPTAAKATTTAARAKVVVACLAKSTKPLKVVGLRSSIKSWLKPATIDDKTVDAILQSLQSSGKIAVDGEKVSYPAT